MKQFSKLLILLLVGVQASAQNIVPNNSFETHNSIPTGYGQWYTRSTWNDVNNYPFFAWPYGNPDYLHTAAAFSSGVQLPSTTFGTLNAHSGHAVIGLAAWLASTPNFREYLAIHLSSPMVVGTAYEVSFYISNGTNNYSGSACDHIAANFSAAPLSQTDHEPINVTPQCDYAAELWSTAWTQISFTFTPTVACQYITIGHFKDDANTSHTWHGVGTDGAYYFIDDVVVQPAIALPVELISFSGFHSEKGNILQWQTASEFNTDHFSVEKSIEGNYFTEIASVAANGIAQLPSDYEYIDAIDLHSLDFYRLKMLDVDGRFSYSNVIDIASTQSFSSAEIFENPGSENILLQCSSSEGVTMEYYVFSIEGKLVKRQVMEMFCGTVIYTINVADLSPGIYFTKVQLGKHIYSGKFVKM